MRKHRKGFTLIELLVVIAIIGILARILLPTIMSAKNKAKRAEAATVIKSLGQQLEAYKLQEGIYPPSSGTTGDNTALVIYLDGIKGNGGPSTAYFEFKKTDLDGTKFVDPWGGYYYYKEFASQGKTSRNETGNPETEVWNIHSFQIWTQAGETDTDQWITNYDK